MKALKSLLGIVGVVAAFYLVWMLFPPYFANYQLEDAMETEARLSSYSSKSEEEIRETLLKKARELEIPISEQQLQVQRSGNTVQIWADYTVHVDLPLYPLDLRFQPSTRNRRI